VDGPRPHVRHPHTGHGAGGGEVTHAALLVHGVVISALGVHAHHVAVVDGGGTARGRGVVRVEGGVLGFRLPVQLLLRLGGSAATLHPANVHKGFREGERGGREGRT
jgi:hypothetical protein